MAGPVYDNKVTIVTATPVTVSDLNTAIAALNSDKYWATIIQFIDANTAAILANFFNGASFGYSADQKVNQVAANQSAVDADKAAEALNDYMPTGLSLTPGGDFLILYTLDPYCQGVPT
jgi:hypothetical protein